MDYRSDSIAVVQGNLASVIEKAIIQFKSKSSSDESRRTPLFILYGVTDQDDVVILASAGLKAIDNKGTVNMITDPNFTSVGLTNETFWKVSDSSVNFTKVTDSDTIIIDNNNNLFKYFHNGSDYVVELDKGIYTKASFGTHIVSKIPQITSVSYNSNTTMYSFETDNIIIRGANTDSTSKVLNIKEDISGTNITSGVTYNSKTNQIELTPGLTIETTQGVLNRYSKCWITIVGEDSPGNIDIGFTDKDHTSDWDYLNVQFNNDKIELEILPTLDNLIIRSSSGKVKITSIQINYALAVKDFSADDENCNIIQCLNIPVTHIYYRITNLASLVDIRSIQVVLQPISVIANKTNIGWNNGEYPVSGNGGITFDN